MRIPSPFGLRRLQRSWSRLEALAPMLEVGFKD
jgi:hypothetical protein